MQKQVTAILTIFVATVAVTTAAWGATGAPFSLTSPTEKDWGPVVLAVVDQERAYPDGDTWCPPDWDPEEICLGASIVRGPARIVRYLSAKPAGWRRSSSSVTVRFIGGHAVRWVDAGRRLAILEQTDKGYLWRSWSTPIKRGWACFPDDVIERFKLTSKVPMRARLDQTNCVRVSVYE